MDKQVSVLNEQQHKHNASAAYQQFTLSTFIPYLIRNRTTLNHLKSPMEDGMTAFKASPYLTTVSFLFTPCQPALSASCEQILSLPIFFLKKMDGCKYIVGQSGTA